MLKKTYADDLYDIVSDTEYHCDVVWPQANAETREVVVQFLMDEAGLPVSEAIKQSHQLLIVVRDNDSNVSAICTVFPVHVESLGFKCFYYRALVGKRHRATGLKSAELGRRLLLQSYHVLDERFAAGCHVDVLGLYLEIENSKVQRLRNEAIWESDGAQFIFIGKTRTSKHCRIAYFGGTRIPFSSPDR